MKNTSHKNIDDNKRKRYRSRNDIIAELLTLAADGTAKTKLMYNAYLSYKQLQDYLSLLLENKMLEFDAGSKKYHTTQKGKNFLEVYEQTKI